MSMRTKLPRAAASCLDVAPADAVFELQPERSQLDRDVRVESLAL
jgi:hypothetical protein